MSERYLIRSADKVWRLSAEVTSAAVNVRQRKTKVDAAKSRACVELDMRLNWPEESVRGPWSHVSVLYLGHQEYTPRCAVLCQKSVRHHAMQRR